MGMRLNSDDGHEGGLGPDEWAGIAHEFEETALLTISPSAMAPISTGC